MSKACGLYRATKPIPAGDDFIAPPRLVYYHNHSQQGGSMVVLPDSNEHNRWSFSEKGFLVDSAAFIEGLVPLKQEGFYRLREHFHPNEDEVVDKDALVQLGYNGVGEPIIFFPTTVKGENVLDFPSSGMRIPPNIYDLLEPLDLKGAYKPEHKHVH